ncbi:MAG: transglutaminase-like putative cysteine protease [Colwellia sp.]|jgi:transglutaminase-like putative cysteine protease
MREGYALPSWRNIPTQNAWALLLCQTLSLSLLINELSSWMIAIIALCLCWRILVFVKPTQKPHRIILLLIACSGSLAIAITGKELGVLLSMLHLLCFAYALKSLEMNSRKDFYQIILLGIFILASVLIFSQSLLISLFVFCLLLLNLSILLTYFYPTRNMTKALIQTAKMVLQSIPLAIVLFIFFPRLAPFWEVPSSKSAQTGLSESVTLGGIAKLARSSALAFRVKFFTYLPQYNQLYWRAMVMDDFDGRTWKQSNNRHSINQTKSSQFAEDIPDFIGDKTHYQVMLEPSYQHWLFSLAVVDIKQLVGTQMNILSLSNYTVKSSKPISQTSSYEVTSYPDSLLNSPLNYNEMRTNLHIPLDNNPKLQAEGRRLQRKYPDEIERAQAILDMIREDDFHYTLTPPLLSGHELDQFFYDSKKGFCVHYASAFTFIMRASGTPARLVTGYLGGEYNKQSGHLSIYQYDAHAWSEIWVNDKGWVRVDPTAAVDPQRVESGLSDTMQQDSLYNNDLLSLHRYKHLAWINSLRLQLDALDYQWTRLVLGYSSKKQYDLVTNWFGHFNRWKVGGIIGGALIFMMMIMWLVNIKKSKKQPLDKWLIQYQQVLAMLKKKGLEKPLTMPASQFSLVVSQHFPLLNRTFSDYTECFEALMYQKLTATHRDERLIEMNQYHKQIIKQLNKCRKYQYK